MGNMEALVQYVHDAARAAGHRMLACRVGASLEVREAYIAEPTLRFGARPHLQ